MTLSVSTADGVTVITLERPDVLNAFDDDLGRRLLTAVEAAASDDDARCIVITGSGRAFSSGEDLGALAGSYERGDVPELGRTLVERYNPLVKAIRAAPKPVVAAVNGVAAGAGASIALACDFRVASEKAKLILAFIKVGLVPDSGGIWFLTRMVGAARAWRVAATGDPIDAAQALEWGLFDRVAPMESFEDEWRSFAVDLASGPTKAFALTKSLVAYAADHSLDEQLEREVQAQTEAGQSADHLEGVQAFLGKRAPKFEGR